MLKKKHLLVIFIILIFSCERKEKTRPFPTKVVNDLPSSSKKVKTLKPKYGDFHLELKTTGKAFAKKKVDLKFKLDEKISNIYVRNGEKISIGQVLAIQKNDTYKNKVIKAQEQLEKSKIDVEDILIGFNHSFQDSINVPKATLNMAKNRGNYNTSLSNLSDAQIELSSTVLKSPINGIVANLETRVYSYPDNSKPFCTIIDNSVFEVEFSVIEDDFIFLSKGQPIEVSSLLNENTLKGTITEINPTVDESGMIKVKGIIKNSLANIIDGMNVNIIIKKIIPNKLFVSKECVVLRDDKDVIFTYEDGKAIWNYVETSIENFDFIVIEKGLKKNDQVIYAGNVNLAHNSSVTKENE